MNPNKRIQLLYAALVFSNNALALLKFSYQTLVFDSSLSTFQEIAVDAYYSMYVNLASLFDTHKRAPNLEQSLRDNKTTKEVDRSEDLKVLSEIVKQHEVTISRVIDIRNKAVAHIGDDIMTADLTQDTMDVQRLIQDLLNFFRGIKSVRVDITKPQIRNYSPKIRDDLGQRELWNSKMPEIIKELRRSE